MKGGKEEVGRDREEDRRKIKGRYKIQQAMCSYNFKVFSQQ